MQGFRVVIFTDIRSSSVLWRKHGQLMSDALDKHDERIVGIANKHGGMVVKTIGDAYMLVFGEGGSKKDENYYIRHAIEMAIELQKSFASDPIPVGPDRIDIRLGMAYGIVNIKNAQIQKCNVKDYFGAIVNIASRMESMMSPVGGMAIALNEKYALENAVNNLIKRSSSTVQIVPVADDCNITDEVVRSMRMLDVRSYECKNSDLLKGVGMVDVLVINI